MGGSSWASEKQLIPAHPLNGGFSRSFKAKALLFVGTYFAEFNSLELRVEAGGGTQGGELCWLSCPFRSESQPQFGERSEW